MSDPASTARAWAGPLDPVSAERNRKGEQDAIARAHTIMRGEAERLSLEDTPEQIVYGHAPGYGPAAAADQLERMWGRFEDVPGWANAIEFADAGLKQAERAVKANPNKPPAQFGEDEFRKNRYLMTPRQLEYMQEVGRTVDLLRGLRGETLDTSNGIGSSYDAGINRPEGAGPAQSAIHYWDKSNPIHNRDAIRTRSDYDDPNYQRFANRGVVEFLGDPTSPISRYLNVAEIIPSAIAFASAGGTQSLSPEETARSWGAAPGAVQDRPGAVDEQLLRAPQQAKNLYDFRGRVRPGSEVPVLDIPSLPENATPEEMAAYDQRYKQRLGELAALEARMAPVSDQSVVNGLLGFDAPPVVADAYGILRSMLDPSFIAGYAAGVPARLAASRTAASAPSALRAMGSELSAQTKPELAFGGAMNTVMRPAPERTLLQYLLRGEPSPPDDAAARDAAHLQFEKLHNSDEQNIGQARTDAYKRASWMQPVQAGQILAPLTQQPQLLRMSRKVEF